MGISQNSWFRGWYQLVVLVDFQVICFFWCVWNPRFFRLCFGGSPLHGLGSSGKTCRSSRKTWAMPGVSGWRRRTGWVQSPQIALPLGGCQRVTDLRLVFFNVCRASLLATKPSFWLNEVRGSWLTGVSQPWPWKTAHYFLLSENLESDCCAGVDGKGTNQDSSDMFKLSLNLDRIHALQSSELINQGDWVHSGMKIRTASPWISWILTRCFFIWDNSGAELSRPGPILEHKTLNLNWQVATPCVFLSVPAGNPASQWWFFLVA
jgi:hypothetical protein